MLKNKNSVKIKNRTKIVVVVDRYIIQYGKFGAYFFDYDTKEHLTLLDVVKMLNDYDKMKSVE